MKFGPQLKKIADEKNKEDLDGALKRVKEILNKRSAEGHYDYRLYVPRHLLQGFLKEVVERWNVQARLSGQYYFSNNTYLYELFLLWSDAEEDKTMNLFGGNE